MKELENEKERLLDQVKHLNTLELNLQTLEKTNKTMEENFDRHFEKKQSRMESEFEEKEKIV